MIEKHYSPREVADLLGVPEKTVGNYLRRDQLRGIKVGIRWRIPTSSLERFLEEGRRKAESRKR